MPSLAVLVSGPPLNEIDWEHEEGGNALSLAQHQPPQRQSLWDRVVSVVAGYLHPAQQPSPLPLPTPPLPLPLSQGLVHVPSQFIRSLTPLDADEISQPASISPPQVLTPEPQQPPNQLIPRNQAPVYGTSLFFGGVPKDYDDDDDDLMEIDAYEDIEVNDSVANDTYIKSVEQYYKNFAPPVNILDYSLEDVPAYSFNDHFADDDFLREVDRRRVAASKPTGVKPLTDSQLQQVTQAWQLRLAEPVASAFNIDITPNDLRTLADRQWLNDNVIDYYNNLVMEANPKVWVWTTHFYTTLAAKGYLGVARWARRKKLDLFTKDRVIVPININNTHWAVTVIDNDKRTITYYDSLDKSGSRLICVQLQEYMNGEANRLGKPAVTYDIIPHGGSPQQLNGYDCGVFTCTNSRMLALGSKLTYSQKDMKTIRRRMAFEILNTKLLP